MDSIAWHQQANERDVSEGVMILELANRASELFPDSLRNKKSRRNGIRRSLSKSARHAGLKSVFCRVSAPESNVFRSAKSWSGHNLGGSAESADRRNRSGSVVLQSRLKFCVVFSCLSVFLSPPFQPHFCSSLSYRLRVFS